LTTFEYLSVFISIVIGLGVVRVLGGVAKLLDRQESKAYWVHSTWVGYFIFWLPWFWWFEFDWRLQTTWTFPVFFFVVIFAMLFYLAVAVLVPTREADYKDLESYFYRVRPRFFVLLTLIYIADVIDAVLKPGNLEDVGPTYGPVMAIYIVGSVVASLTEHRLFHQIWVVVVGLMLVFFSLGIYADVFTTQ
jgi:hypothetical protein